MRLVLLTLVLAASCGPTVQPRRPGSPPVATGGVQATPLPPAPAPGAAREMVVGEMCPDRAGGRPAVSLVALRRSLEWSGDPGEIEPVLARGSVQPLTVFGYRGNRAGTFTVAGPVDTGAESPTALGSYAGADPCADKETEAECRSLYAACGPAAGRVLPYGSDEPADVATGGACVQRSHLVLDVDRDGSFEAFALDAFLDDFRAPTGEVTGRPVSGEGCDPRFALPRVVAGADPKVWNGLDVVGVLDLDGDGRMELILQYRYGDKRTWALFAATQTATRLALVAESAPWL